MNHETMKAMGRNPILIVDNDLEMRRALGYSLANQGFVVDQCATTLDAIEKIETNDYAMVITDETMPHMTGFEILEEIKKIRPSLPVVIMTGYGSVEKSVQAMRLGAVDYIVKPFSSDKIAGIAKVHATAKPLLHHHTGETSFSFASEAKPIVTRDRHFMKVLHMAENVAKTKATILIQGESGTGKELLAAFIHEQSGREGSYIAVNCAALPENLAESELFGHEKGAFTGALKRKPGKFELADSGTLVLDEITELSLHLQAKLLRVIQERKIDRVGGYKSLPMDFRLIAVSNMDLKTAVQENTFREDLYYRINVIPLHIPPLRERKEDILLLSLYFMEKYGRLYNRCDKCLSESAKRILVEHTWRGNVRELENAMERAVLLSMDAVLITEDHLVLDGIAGFGNMDVMDTMGTNTLSLKDLERKFIYKTLKDVKDNRTHAAQRLGISIRTLRNKLNEYKEETDTPKKASGI